MTAITPSAPVALHPRIRARRAEVADQSERSRRRWTLAIAAVLAVATVAALLTQSPALDVDEVRVVGASSISPETVRELSGVRLGSPLLGLDLDAATQTVGAARLVADASVERSWNGVVTITVEERVPTAQFLTNDGALVVDSDGIVIEEVSFDAVVSAVEVPWVSGAMFSAAPGTIVPSELVDALVVAEALPADLRFVTERIELTVDSVSLRLVGGGVASLGDARALDEKYAALRSFIEQVDLSCLDELKLSAPTVPVIVRRASC